jgi:hypothetical protein
MNSATPDTRPELTPEQIEAKFTKQENQFLEQEKNISLLRAFFLKYRKPFAQFQWRAYGIDNEISFDCNYQNVGRAKDIARAFGSDGWTRKKNSYTCGQIDWFKDIGEVTLKIEGAEHLNLNLIEEVKL